MLQYSLLEHQPRAVGLLERLAIPVLSPSTLISRALLPEFLSLEEAVQKSVLDYVVRHWDGLDQTELTAALAAAPFVTTGHHHLSQICFEAKSMAYLQTCPIECPIASNSSAARFETTLFPMVEVTLHQNRALLSTEGGRSCCR